MFSLHEFLEKSLRQYLKELLEILMGKFHQKPMKGFRTGFYEDSLRKSPERFLKNIFQIFFERLLVNGILMEKSRNLEAITQISEELDF